MSVNNDGNNKNLPKGIAQSSSPFRNSNMGSLAMPTNQAFASLQSQAQLGSGFPGQFQLSQAQAHAAQVRTQIQSQLQAQGMSGLANVGSGSPSFTSPASMLVKRFPQKPPVWPPGGPMTNMVSPLRNMDLSSAARKKKQKIPEKSIHDRVAAILPDSALYTQLLEFEACVDAALTRKKMDIQEALKRPPCVQKTLRIYVFNTFANQNKTIPKKSNAEPPTWTLKIVGRILEDGVDPDQSGVAQMSSPMYPKFLSFFKRVTISLDQRLYPGSHIIIWEQPRSSAPHEGFEVKRKGDKEFIVNIRLEINYVPEKFKLSPALTEVLGTEVETRPRIIAAIWHYVKARKLQSLEDPSLFLCDPPLQKVFGEPRMKFTMVLQKISQLLVPPQPIHLEHKIKLSGDNPAGTACYDVVVDIPFPIQRDLSNLLANTEKNKEIDACHEAICSNIKKIHEHSRRRAFFLGFSQSPAEFINAMIESQSRDLKYAAGEGGRNAEKEHSSDFFSQPWVEDAVIRYLNRKPAAGSDAPGST